MNFDKKIIAVLIRHEYGKLEFGREINRQLDAGVLFWMNGKEQTLENYTEGG